MVSRYVFTIVSYLIGVFIFATIVGQVGNVITNRNANRLEFERLLDGAKTYMRHHKVPGGMKRRVLRWYDYSWSRGRIQGGGDINTALGLLPDKLKTELALHVTIFQECQPEFLHDLVLKMKAYIFTPGDLICRKGEVAREMFIIADGILEVISETGRVLTTMKAGDFFGEIGILNLDGLNKRTADVRSVGYSELFSLSREDVLAAMKDYPEAQEILQSLGRKRLMEARNVSRTKPSHHDKGGSTTTGAPGAKDGAAGADGDGRAGKRIVEKLRSDVKGLKNVLRKSRRGTRTKDESMELQPLNPGSVEIGRQSSAHSGKGVLRRMSRVRSDENYSREESLEDQPAAAPTAKIGEGLPLLNRLRLLKEKQDREEKGKPLLTPTSPPPTTGTLSPPTLKLQPPDEPKPQQEPEVIGAGLPLIQRLLLLKQKEERERLAVQATATVAADVLATTVKSQQDAESKSVESSISPPGKKGKSSSDESRHSSSSKEHSEDESVVISRKPSLLNRLVAVKHKDSSASGGKQSSASSAGVSPQQKSDASAEPATPTTAAPKVPLFREKLKLLTQKDNTMPSSSTSSSTSTVTSPPKVQAQTSAKSDVQPSSTGSVVPVLKKQHSWSLLKKASILSSQNSAESSKAPTSRTATSQSSLSVSEQVQSDGTKGSELKEETSEDLKRTATSDEAKVITVHEKSDSDSIPSKPLSPSPKTSEVGSVKPVSLFKQKMAKLTGDISVPQSSRVQDKLKTGETQAIAQGEGRTEGDNKQEVKPIELSKQGESEASSECPKETESSSDTTKESETQTAATVAEPSTSMAEESSPLKRRSKPNLLRLQQDTKFYMSIDDLSPEYSGLPFVKKLKILNERQKLAELEQKVAHVLMRSSSLDSGNTGAGVCADSLDYSLDPTNLTRSHSEASAMQFVRSQQRTRSAFIHASSQTSDRREDESSTPPQRPTELPQPSPGEAPQSLASPESNETLERRNLKSILKKLSASSLFSGSSEDTTKGSGSSGELPEPVVPAPPTEQTSTVDMRKLMRAPTIEGYAARHSKLTKSVTFNRDTLQSPPATAITPTRLAEEPSGSLFPLPATSDDETESMSTSATTVSAVVTSVLVSSEAHSSTSSTTPIAQQQILSAVTTAVTVALTTTMTSTVSSTVLTTIGTTISTASVVSSPAPIQKTVAEPTVVSAPAMSTTSDDPSLMPPPPPPLTEVIDSSLPLKKKSPVSFLVQHPQIPLSANEKNFFRPSLLLPSHASLEEEYFNEEEIQNKFQTQFQSLELEVKRRDEIISQLQKRIHELEHPDATEINGDDDDDASEGDDGSDQPFMRGDSVDTVLASPPPTLPDDNLEDEVEDRTESQQLSADERPYQRIVSPSHSGLRQRQMYRRSWEDHSEEETMELLDLPRSMSPQHVWCAEDEDEEEQKKPEVPRDCVALDLGSSDSSSSSSSSDSSNDEDDMFGMDDDLQTVGHNRDWEVQMLARELERREDISRLEDEVRDLKAAVSSSDLSLLSSSELDILEQVLVAKDRKVRAAARALSLDSDDSFSEERSLHPMSRHKPDLRSSSLSSSLNKRRLLKQRSTNGGGSIENLLYRTSLLKNRLLSATTRRHQLLNARSLDESPETSQKTSVSTVEHRRNRRASSGSIPVTRPQFTLPSASSLMRGLGNLVRTSSGGTTSQTGSHHTRQSTSSLESAGSDRSTVPTISRSCGQVSPVPSHHTSDPPPPDL
ncbi:hypothetical protein C0J52_08291 [Blattella germanica]|nr:hypothetical protein C0J52_08291 [Blattella germanica]